MKKTFKEIVLNKPINQLPFSAEFQGATQRNGYQNLADLLQLRYAQDLLKKKSDEQENFIIKLKQDNNILMKQCNDTQTLFHKNHDHLVRKKKELFFIDSLFFFLFR